MNNLVKKKGISSVGLVALAMVFLFTFAITAQADMTIHFTLLNSQQSDPNAAWWAGKSNMLFDHNNSGFPGADDMVWDWWGYNKDFTGSGHYYFSEINFDCHEKTGGGSSGTPDCSIEDYYFKGLPCGYIDRLRESADARDSTFDLTLSGAAPVYNVDYGDTVEVYGWALVKAIMRHTSDFSFAEPGQGAQASGGTYDSGTNVLDAWVNINLDFINPIPSTPTGMSPIDTQEAWVDGFGQKGYIIPNAEFTAWHDGTSVPEADKYMVPTYTLGAASPYPDEYIETGEEDMGPWLDDLVNNRLGDVWDEIADADYLYIAFSRDNFVIDNGDYTSVDSDGIAGNEGKTSADGANLMSLHAEAWPILAKTFLNDEVVWIAAGYEEEVLMPDLIISEKSEEWIDPSDPSQGYKVYYTVKNQGGATAGASETCLDIDGINQGSQPCDALNPNETYSGTFEGPFFCSDSSDTIEVCADCNGDVAESDEDNNCRENEWTCSAVSEPDLVISEKSEEWIDPADLSQGYKVHYTVKNQGNANATQSSNTCLFIDGASVESQSCPALAVGATHSDTFDGNFTCDGSDDNVTVCADCDEEVTEANEDNNCKENVWSCSANIFDIGNGAGEPGVTDRTVAVSLKNDVAVAGIQVDICDAGDYLSLPNADDVELTDRATGFSVAFEDDYPVGDCARLVLYSEGGSVIAAGDGPIIILHYDVAAGATDHSCVEITSANLLITDVNDEPLTAAEDPGTFFLGIYGDPWPYDNVTGTVGDGEVNIFDVVRDVQIILGTYTPVDCEFVAGDVPTGFGTNCEAPDGEINISDVLEMVRKILGRDNCIDLY